jgi:hypothetical protein
VSLPPWRFVYNHGWFACINVEAPILEHVFEAWFRLTTKVFGRVVVMHELLHPISKNHIDIFEPLLNTLSKESTYYFVLSLTRRISAIHRRSK